MRTARKDPHCRVCGCTACGPTAARGGGGMQMGILESDARWLFQQLLIAVDYCHRLGIANRDIKACAAASATPPPPPLPFPDARGLVIGPLA